MIRRWMAMIALVCSYACAPDLPEEVKVQLNQLPAELDFNVHVKPILSDKCFACHGPDKAKQQAGLRLDLAEAAYNELPESPGKYAIVPGDLSSSEVFQRIITDDHEYIMPTPKSNLKLSAREKAILVKWIDDGAEYKDHWAFLPPQKPAIPEVSADAPINNSIDQFVQAELQRKNLSPAPTADKETLLRRLSLDLTGLPPTVAEIDAFLADHSPNAYEQQVDRLLASAHYGERMAADWLDLARYADTHGYTVDRYRNMSPWRDWVIESFNDNLPYDQFLTWQLAGDLLPNPTREQILATGFNRLHPQNMEGGIVNEEFRVEYVADRTSVLGQGVMAMTLACARCHDHKYDPISQKNFFELYSFFNSINESGQISWDEKDMPVPTLMLTTEQQQEVLDYIDRELTTQSQRLTKIEKSTETDFQKWLDAKAYQKLDLTANRHLVAHFDLNGQLKNKAGSGMGKMDRKFSKGETANFVPGHSGQGLLLDGDAWLDMYPQGIYSRSDRFSISLWVKFPEDLKEGVIFHKNIGSRLHNFKGYQLYFTEGKLQVMLAHTWPDNAISKWTKQEVKRNEWMHLTMTYDGSSTADGLQLYIDGASQYMEVEIDNLYKDIIYSDSRTAKATNDQEPGIKVGARWRGQGVGNTTVDDIMIFDECLSFIEVLALAQPTTAQQFLAQNPTQLSSEDKKHLHKYYLQYLSKDYQQTRSVIAQLQQQKTDSMQRVQEVMVMKEMNEPRQSYLLERGLYDAHGEKVYPNTPEAILPMADTLPKNRLGLAQWITSPQNPLTARVAVNRYWQMFLGSGIVKTTEDFGNQGSLPTHPELLDWMAVTFVESGWDVKALVRQIVLSKTYMQSSMASQELKEIDPDNSWLARGPQARLSGEMLRDNALKASGILYDKIGGESVYPYQPDDLWSMNSAIYQQDTGRNLYRRSLYTIWKRTVPHPTLSTFDQPDRNECTVRRQKTNTPLQALVLLNDPTYVEAARIIGEKITQYDSTQEGIRWAFRSLTGRKPSDQELALLLDMSENEYEIIQENPKMATGWLHEGQHRIATDLNPQRVAANTLVASTIINSDASITKR
ncbi:DUF1553 domain-containing protein [Reichenbachiella agarivorans]|uniref:DUF1553 domain-containing protein n=1 Tax=Reichenbachiella agarivorans TaxID=2979464 RepID=A0ABY6CNE4_9BACT|nr:DUF1553 domain-containing protein [Reichenbachiella agarivorans]UXP32032.1 DUF1553 domain-containing protein [Reichenbachiella agarivorans]